MRKCRHVDIMNKVFVLDQRQHYVSRVEIIKHLKSYIVILKFWTRAGANVLRPIKKFTHIYNLTFCLPGLCILYIGLFFMVFFLSNIDYLIYWDSFNTTFLFEYGNQTFHWPINMSTIWMSTQECMDACRRTPRVIAPAVRVNK